MESELPSRVQEEVGILNHRHQLSQSLEKKPNYQCFEEDNDDDDPELMELLRLVECPVCKDIPIPPIYNCSNGHFVCDACRPQLVSQNCAYCLADFTNMRNFPLEALVTAPVVKCDFTKYGCSEKRLSLTEYEEHVRHCWAQLWRPGEVKRFPLRSSQKSNLNDYEDREGSPCQNCLHINSPRKIKCQMCQLTLRVPTPMFVPFDFQFETCVSPELELTLQIL